MSIKKLNKDYTKRYKKHIIESVKKMNELTDYDILIIFNAVHYQQMMFRNEKLQKKLKGK